MKRRKTRQVFVGNVGIGGVNPIRIQSMTKTSTSDVEATVGQIIRLADEGCEIARVTVQGKREAEACEKIKNSLLQKGYTIPLVADIHFYPRAAFLVIPFVDKIRINPGNFVDRRAVFQMLPSNVKSYQEAIQRIEHTFGPFVEECKKKGKAIRIGVNHGSLSDRIMSCYGNTPLGMVESALEFAHVCRKLNYHDFLFSMKASTPQVMIESYRLLVHRMEELEWDYPLHLGVTEAGGGEDGRIKSAIGIGTLLLEGIGDTIRVSLTEDPWEEIQPCLQLIQLAESYYNIPFDLKVTFSKRSLLPQKLPAPLHPNGSVLLFLKEDDDREFLKCLDPKPDLILLERKSRKNKQQILLQNLGSRELHTFKIKNLTDWNQGEDTTIAHLQDGNFHIWEKLFHYSAPFLLFSPPFPRTYYARFFFHWMEQQKLNVPILYFLRDYGENIVIDAAAELGSLLIDGYGEGFCIQSSFSLEKNCLFSFAILQACRKRLFKTEFISCPGCGRTLFDLQRVTGQVQSRTSHLPGVKIAIMGCIVNGPGEMADADFGYVGSSSGKVDLYVGENCVEKNIDARKAPDRLVALIKSHNRWIEP